MACPRFVHGSALPFKGANPALLYDMSNAAVLNLAAYMVAGRMVLADDRGWFSPGKFTPATLADARAHYVHGKCGHLAGDEKDAAMLVAGKEFDAVNPPASLLVSMPVTPETITAPKPLPTKRHKTGG